MGTLVGQSERGCNRQHLRWSLLGFSQDVSEAIRYAGLRDARALFDVILDAV
jgi:hypothetical protein